MDLQILIYKCKECGQNCTYAQAIKDNDSTLCPHCELDALAYDHSRMASWCSVAVYFTSRAYGGAEEGGWWYNTGERDDQTVRCFEEGDFPQVELYRELLKRRYPERDCRVIIYMEMLPPRSFPESKPYYS